MLATLLFAVALELFQRRGELPSLKHSQGDVVFFAKF